MPVNPNDTTRWTDIRNLAQQLDALYTGPRLEEHLLETAEFEQTQMDTTTITYTYEITPGTTTIANHFAVLPSGTTNTETFYGLDPSRGLFFKGSNAATGDTENAPCFCCLLYRVNLGDLSFDNKEPESAALNATQYTDMLTSPDVTSLINSTHVEFYAEYDTAYEGDNITRVEAACVDPVTGDPVTNYDVTFHLQWNSNAQAYNLIQVDLPLTGIFTWKVQRFAFDAIVDRIRLILNEVACGAGFETFYMFPRTEAEHGSDAFIEQGCPVRFVDLVWTLKELDSIIEADGEGCFEIKNPPSLHVSLPWDELTCGEMEDPDHERTPLRANTVNYIEKAVSKLETDMEWPDEDGVCILCPQISTFNIVSLCGDVDDAICINGWTEYHQHASGCDLLARYASKTVTGEQRYCEVECPGCPECDQAFNETCADGERTIQMCTGLSQRRTYDEGATTMTVIGGSNYNLYPRDSDCEDKIEGDRITRNTYLSDNGDCPDDCIPCFTDEELHASVLRCQWHHASGINTTSYTCTSAVEIAHDDPPCDNNVVRRERTSDVQEFIHDERTLTQELRTHMEENECQRTDCVVATVLNKQERLALENIELGDIVLQQNDDDDEPYCVDGMHFRFVGDDPSNELHWESVGICYLCPYETPLIPEDCFRRRRRAISWLVSDQEIDTDAYNNVCLSGDAKARIAQFDLAMHDLSPGTHYKITITFHYCTLDPEAPAPACTTIFFDCDTDEEREWSAITRELEIEADNWAEILAVDCDACEVERRKCRLERQAAAWNTANPTEPPRTVGCSTPEGDVLELPLERNVVYKLGNVELEIIQ